MGCKGGGGQETKGKINWNSKKSAPSEAGICYQRALRGEVLGMSSMNNGIAPQLKGSKVVKKQIMQYIRASKFVLYGMDQHGRINK